MVDNNLSGTEPGPDVTTPPTQESLVEDISNLLEDPETDLPEESEDEAAASDEPEDDPLGLDDEAEDVEAADDSEDDDGSDAEVKGGRFAPDSAKVKLDTGETITIADLKVRVDKRVKEFQRGFTEKTTALSAKEASVDQQAQSLDEFRDYAAWYAETYLPKQPEPFSGAPDDYVGFLEWQRKNAEWQAHAQAFDAFKQHKHADEQRKKGETDKQFQERRLKEAEALGKAIPVLKDPVKGKVAWDAMVAGAADFGFTAEEMDAVVDHRLLVALREAIAHRRTKAKALQAPAEVAKRPAMKSGRRAPPQAAASREQQVRSERLRNSGRLDDFVAAASHLFE